MRIAIIGYGKMGHMVEEVALSRGHEITCVIDRFAVRPSQSDCKTANAVGPATPVRFYSPEEGFESEAFRSADVAIEFTTPATAKENVLRAWAQGVPVVCGTTGWINNLNNPTPTLPSREGEWIALNNTDNHNNHNNPTPSCSTDSHRLSDRAELFTRSREGAWKTEQTSNRVIVRDERGKVMLVWSSNYSVGVNIFFELNKFLAEEMGHLTPTLSQGEGEKSGGYTPSIKEIHHIHKLDKPSGTAKTLAEQIRDAEMSKYRDIEIESVREGEVPGTHEVTWDSEEDTIVITHIAKGRRGFALGAVMAAETLGLSHGDV